MTQVSDIVDITINVDALRITAAGFGTPLILAEAEASVFPARTKAYVSMSEIGEDWATDSLVWFAANSMLSQSNAPNRLLVGRIETADVNITEALDAIVAENDSWYALLPITTLKQDLLDVSLWAESRIKIVIGTTEDEDILVDTIDTDLLSVMQGLGYNRSSIIWHQHAGRDEPIGGATYVSLLGVLTVTAVAHGLEIGDPIVVSNAVDINVNGNRLVVSVPSADTYTLEIADALDQVSPVSLNYFAGYVGPHTAWAGVMLPKDPGSATWANKTLVGIIASDLIDLGGAEETTVVAKGGNVFTLLGALGIGSTRSGQMVGGRFMDLQRGIDWLEARIGEAVVVLQNTVDKIPYTDAGVAQIQSVITPVLGDAITRGVAAPLLDSVSGELYRITAPSVASQSAADRAARIYRGLEIQLQFAGAIHKTEITINVQT